MENTKRNEDGLTKNEAWIVDFLMNKGCFVSSKEIGYYYARAFGFSIRAHYAACASKVCGGLVKKGILMRSERGEYAINWSATKIPKGE